MSSHKPDAVITDDVITDRPIRKVMVTGSRTWGRCECVGHGVHHGGPMRCPAYRAAWRQMVSAFQRHVPDRVLPAPEPIQLFHGDADGADRMAAAIWERYALGPIVAYPANWESLGKRAGHVRNGILVANMPDLVLAFHLHNSPGTADAIAQAKAAGLRVEIYPKEQA